MDGWIKIYRKIMENPMYLSEPFTRMQAWIDLLLIANRKDGFFYIRGNKVIVHRGQIGLSERTLAVRWKWSRGKVSRFLKDLENEHQIEPQKNSVTTLISISNYDEYQCNEPQTDPQTDHRRTTDGPKQEKKEYNKKESSTIVEPKKKISLTLIENLEKRNKSFYESLVPYVDVYGKELIRAFYDYWTEPNKSKTKMRFELEKTWDVKRRLNTWASREKINSKSHGTDKTKASEQRASEILELNKRLNDAGY